MIRVDSILDTRALADIEKFVTTYPQHAATVVTSAWEAPQGKPALMAALQAYPRERSGKWGGWSPDPKKNARAAAWWFAAVRDGRVKTNGRHYIRTGKLGKGYQSRLLRTTNGEILISVKNTENRAYRWTKGKRQIIGHALTGWRQDTPIIAEWSDNFRRYIVRELNAVAFAITGQAPR